MANDSNREMSRKSKNTRTIARYACTIVHSHVFDKKSIRAVCWFHVFSRFLTQSFSFLSSDATLFLSMLSSSLSLPIVSCSHWKSTYRKKTGRLYHSNWYVFHRAYICALATVNCARLLVNWCAPDKQLPVYTHLRRQLSRLSSTLTGQSINCRLS